MGKRVIQESHLPVLIQCQILGKTQKAMLKMPEFSKFKEMHSLITKTKLTKANIVEKLQQGMTFEQIAEWGWQNYLAHLEKDRLKAAEVRQSPNIQSETKITQPEIKIQVQNCVNASELPDKGVYFGICIAPDGGGGLMIDITEPKRISEIN